MCFRGSRPKSSGQLSCPLALGFLLGVLPAFLKVGTAATMFPALVATECALQPEGISVQASWPGRAEGCAPSLGETGHLLLSLGIAARIALWWGIRPGRATHRDPRPDRHSRWLGSSPGRHPQGDPACRDPRSHCDEPPAPSLLLSAETTPKGASWELSTNTREAACPVHLGTSQCSAARPGQGDTATGKTPSCPSNTPSLLPSRRRPGLVAKSSRAWTAPGCFPFDGSHGWEPHS